MTEKDRIEFKRLMAKMGEASVGNEEMRRPSPNKCEIYFDFLKDLPFEIIVQNANLHFRRNKWFPAISELRNEADENSRAVEAYSIIEELMDNLYDPMLGTCCLNAMNEKLDSMGKSYLKPVLMKWGTEIWSRQNITATRAQFLKSFPTEIKGIDTSRQLEMKKPKLIAENLSVTVKELEVRAKMVKERNMAIKQIESHENNIFEQERKKLEQARKELHE